MLLLQTHRELGHEDEHEHDYRENKGEQNGCRQRLEGYLSCQQRLSLAVA